jgi:hypothetical protein
MWRIVWLSKARWRPKPKIASMVVSPGAIGAELQVATQRLSPKAVVVCANASVETPKPAAINTIRERYERLAENMADSFGCGSAGVCERASRGGRTTSVQLDTTTRRLVGG